MKKPAVAEPSRALAAEFHMGPVERANRGHIGAWATAAREAYDACCRALERDPEATVILTVSVQK